MVLKLLHMSLFLVGRIMIDLVLTWPPSPLSPNARLHWSKVAKAKKKYRALIFAETLEQLGTRPFHSWFHLQLSEKLILTMTFVPPDNRSYDRDNLTARMKAGIDGMSDALKIDDKQFHTVIATVDKTRVRKGTVLINIKGENDGEKN